MCHQPSASSRFEREPVEAAVAAAVEAGRPAAVGTVVRSLAAGRNPVGHIAGTLVAGRTVDTLGIGHSPGCIRHTVAGRIVRG